MVYKLLFVAILIIGYLLYNQSSIEWGRRGYIAFSSIVLGLQSALRNVAVGEDTYNYYLKFEAVKDTTWLEVFKCFPNTYLYGDGKDPGYLLLEKLFQVISDDFRVFLFFIAIVFFYAYAKLLFRYCSNIIEVLTANMGYLTLFYGFYSITGLRQTISVALSILFLLAFIDKDYRKCILLFIVAFVIHKSSIFILLVPILYSFKKNRLLLSLYCLAFVVFLFGRNYFVNMALVASDYEAIEIPLPLLLDVLYFVISLFMWNRLKHDDRKILSLFNVYCLTFAWIPLLGNDSPLMRVILYFNIYVLVLLPRAISRTPLYKKLLFLCINLFFIYYAISTRSEYAFFWEEMQLPSHYL